MESPYSTARRYGEDVNGGLIVEDGDRGSGIGRCLMQQAEKWADEKGCKTVLVRSNIIRKSAHHFYEKIGYSRGEVKSALVV